MATPEDVEYYDCQQEMMQDLTESHKNVERIIGLHIFVSENSWFGKDALIYFIPRDRRYCVNT